MVTVPELVKEVGLKLQDEAVGKPLQLKLTVPAVAPKVMAIVYCAVPPAVIVALGVLEVIATTGPMLTVAFAVLLDRSASPPPETVELMDAVEGAFAATLNATVTSG
jgi:hypothetical protein